MRRISYNQNPVHQDCYMFWIGYLILKLNRINVMFHICVAVIGKYVHMTIIKTLITFGTTNFMDNIKGTKYLVQRKFGNGSLFTSFQGGDQWVEISISSADLEIDKEKSVYFILTPGRPHLHQEYTGRSIKQEIEGNIANKAYRFCSPLDEDEAQDIIFRKIPKLMRWKFK